MSIRITNVQRFCVSDGPGIRTTVFLKGCNLRCPWCSNPETIQFELQPFKVDGECGTYGKDIEPNELFDELVRDRVYWGTDGGVTFSGGEALLQIKELLPLLKRLSDEHIDIAFETALHTPMDSVHIAIEYADFLYVDVKILVKDDCSRLLQGKADRFLENVERVCESDVPVTFRVPCADSYTLSEKNEAELLAFFLRYPDVPVELFAVHNLGERKYRSLGITPPEAMMSNRLKRFYSRLVGQGNHATILSL